MEDVGNFAVKHNIPVTQTVMGYSTMKKDHSHFLGPIGGLGGKAANSLAKKTDLAIAVGTKLGDFTTAIANAKDYDEIIEVVKRFITKYEYQYSECKGDRKKAKQLRSLNDEIKRLETLKSW